MSVGEQQPKSMHADSGSLSDAYQVDVVVALFAILLVLLLTSTARLQSEPVRDTLMDYRPDDPSAALFQLRSMAPTYPYRSLWVAKDDRLTRIDLRAIAERYEAAADLEYEEWLPPADLRVAPGDTGLDAFRLDIAFSGTGIPEPLVAQHLALDDPATAAAIGALGPGALIYVWEGQLQALQPVLSQLRIAGTCHKLNIEPRRQTVALVRDYASFLEHRVLRCY